LRTFDDHILSWKDKDRASLLQRYGGPPWCSNRETITGAAADEWRRLDEAGARIRGHGFTDVLSRRQDVRVDRGERRRTREQEERNYKGCCGRHSPPAAAYGERHG
jgi:hypothetical protein